MTQWTPRATHLSQLEDWGDGTGLNGHANCGEAALARYLRESGYPFSGTDHDLIAYLRQTITGVANSAANGATMTGQIESFLDGLGFDGSWTRDVSAYNTPGAACLLLLAAADLQPAQYPFGWLGTWDIDHYILRLPSGLYNDPLAYNNGQADCSYTATSVLTALGAGSGGYVNVLPDPHTVTWRNGRAVVGAVPISPTPEKPVTPAPTGHLPHQGPRYKVLTQMLARKAPDLDDSPRNVFFLPNGQPQTLNVNAVLNGTGQMTGHWREVTAGGHTCWALVTNMQPV